MESNSNASPGPTQTLTLTQPTSFFFLSPPPPPPPPFPAAPRSVDLSALEFILALIAVISIPALIYTFFFAINCPRRSSSASASPSPRDSELAAAGEAAARESEVIRGGDLTGECSICLSAIGNGEEVKKLSACGHAFHTACVDKWLIEHGKLTCPVCRDPIPAPANGNRSNSQVQRSSRMRSGDDFHHGLPDASNLV